MASNISENFLKTLIYDHWNIRCDQIEPLDGYVCVNFKIKHEEDYLVLKIFGEEESTYLNSMEFQTKLMVHLENQDGLRTNSLIKTRKGDSFATQDMLFAVTGSVTRRVILLFTYIPGYPLTECSDPSPQLFQQVGEFVGHLSNAMQSMPHSGATIIVPDVFEMANAAKVREYFHLLPVFEGQKLSEIFTNCEKAVAGIELTRGVVHNDINAQNILISPEDGLPNGIIDFELAGHSCIIYDLAVLLVHVPARFGQCEDFLQNAKTLLEGFSQRDAVTREGVETAEVFDDDASYSEHCNERVPVRGEAGECGIPQGRSTGEVLVPAEATGEPGRNLETMKYVVSIVYQISGASMTRRWREWVSLHKRLWLLKATKG